MINFTILIILATVFLFIYKTVYFNVIRKRNHKINSLSKEALMEIKTNAAKLCESGNLNEAIKLWQVYVKCCPNDVDIRLLLGSAYLEKSKNKNAIEQLEHVVKIKPDNLTAHKLLGDTYFSMKESGQAATHYRRVLDGDPTNLEIRYKMLSIYKASGNNDDIVYELQKIIKYNSNDVEARKLLADIYLEKKDYYNASIEYKAAFLTDKNPETFKKLAITLKQTRKYDELIDLYNKHLKDNPDDIQVLAELAEIYVILKDYNEPKTLYKKIIKLEYTNKTALNRLSQILILNNEVDKAIFEATALSLSVPDFDDAKLTLIDAYKAKGLYSNAVLVYQNLLIESFAESMMEKYKKDLSNLICEWGSKLFAQKLYKDAIDKFINSLNYNENNCLAYFNLGKANLAIKNYDAAISNYKRALELSEPDCDLYLQIGHLYDEIDEIKAAADYYIDALNIEPLNPQAHYLLAMAYLKLEEYKRAIDEFKIAIDLHHGNLEDVYFNLAIAYEALGQYIDSKEAYCNVLEINSKNLKARENLAQILETESKAESINI